jgi:enoyl-CoA hydratase
MELPALKNIELTREGAILVATLARPEALNALNQDSLESLSQLADFVAVDGDTRVLILTGKGEWSFVAGADINSFESMSAEAAAEFSRYGQVVFTKLSKLEKPVLAAVNGFALGGGLELALACDLILASEKAKFALPECKLGLTPGFGGTVRLPRRVGTAKALEMALTGNMISADEALKIGLVVKVVPHGEALKATTELAQAMVTRAPVALGLIKRLILEGDEQDLKSALDNESRIFGEVFKTADKVEGVRAFIEGREPRFSGR